MDPAYLRGPAEECLSHEATAETHLDGGMYGVTSHRSLNGDPAEAVLMPWRLVTGLPDTVHPLRSGGRFEGRLFCREAALVERADAARPP